MVWHMLFLPRESFGTDWFYSIIYSAFPGPGVYTILQDVPTDGEGAGSAGIQIGLGSCAYTCYWLQKGGGLHEKAP